VTRALNFIYGCYAWLALLAIVIPLCVVLSVLPGIDRRRRVARAAAQLFFFAIGSPVRVDGSAIEPHFPCVVVANHASYLDGIILTAALPAGFTYLIKHEMSRVPLAGFVRGSALGFFPEGTFDGTPGLKPFHLGAFSAAARAKLPVVPVVIFGARRKLPSGALLPRLGSLRVHVCEAVRPHPAAATAHTLMVETRRTMLARLDEPDLAREPAYMPE
jgi:1-acyl-sn-glycerol-3-phosphate acyltransferase